MIGEIKMVNEVNLGCDLFVDANVSEESLASELAQSLGNSAEGKWVETNEGLIIVKRNDEFNAEMRKDPSDGFLYYRLRIEIEPTIELGLENAVSLVSNLLEHLWSRDYSAVASCSYEDELPHKGGYKSIYTPSVFSEKQSVER